MYTYTADSRGFRIIQHRVLQGSRGELDTVPDNNVGNDLAEEKDGDRDVKSHRDPKKLRLRRKVLVKRHRSVKAQPKSLKMAKLKVKKLGKAVDIIPYQQKLLLR